MRIGLIGLGDMGILYARSFARHGHEVYGTDLVEKNSDIAQTLKGSGVIVSANVTEWLPTCDWVIFSVESQNINKVVQHYARWMGDRAWVSGQTAVKREEVKALLRYSSKSAQIFSLHSMHAPSVSPIGQTLLLIPVRVSRKTLAHATKILSSAFGSKVVQVKNAPIHDRMMADIQVMTHLGFQSMGTAWATRGFYPWENPVYSGGIDAIKILMMLRIFSGKAHVYRDIAMLSREAEPQIMTYRDSVRTLYSLSDEKHEREFRREVVDARDWILSYCGKTPILSQSRFGNLRLELLSPRSRANSHLSLLAMGLSWRRLRIDPFANLICQTPPYRLRLGIVESLFRNKKLLEQSIHAAVYDKNIKKDDRSFVRAVERWSKILIHKKNKEYQRLFEQAQLFFKTRLSSGLRKSNELIEKTPKK